MIDTVDYKHMCEEYRAAFEKRSSRFKTWGEEDFFYIENARVEKSDDTTLVVSDTDTGEIIWTQSIPYNPYFSPYGFFNSPYSNVVFVVDQPHRMYCIYEDTRYGICDYGWVYLLRLWHHNTHVDAIHIGVTPNNHSGRKFEPVFEHIWEYDNDNIHEQNIIGGCDEYTNVTACILEDMFENKLVTIPVNVLC